MTINTDSGAKHVCNWNHCKDKHDLAQVCPACRGTGVSPPYGFPARCSMCQGRKNPDSDLDVIHLLMKKRNITTKEQYDAMMNEAEKESPFAVRHE